MRMAFHKTAEGRVRVAEKIHAEAERYGIRERISSLMHWQCTISSDQKVAEVTRQTLKRNPHVEFQGNTILDISNISFGLPKRETVNQDFISWR